MTAPALDEPSWCSPRHCRAAVGGTHRSEPIQSHVGETTVTVWLQQRPGDVTLFGLASAWRTTAGITAWLPLREAERLLAAASGLVDHGLADEANRRPPTNPT
jgi:hypothetical protein